MNVRVSGVGWVGAVQVGAIFGQASATSGFNNGVWGRTYSTAGVGVRGEALASVAGTSLKSSG